MKRALIPSLVLVASLAAAPVFLDDFSAGIGTWSTSKGAEIQKEGDNAFLVQPGGKNRYATRSFAEQKGKVTLRFRADAKKGLTLRTGFTELILLEDGVLRVKSDKDTKKIEWKEKGWALVTVVADYGAKTFSVKVGNAAPQEGFAFQSSCKDAGLSKLTLLAYGEQATAIDDVSVGD